MEKGKCEQNEDIKITLEDSKLKDSKVEDKSINFKWKVKTKVIYISSVFIRNPLINFQNVFNSILIG